jgi:hypothetical protein
MKIIWTFHAQERLNEWAAKFGIKKEEVKIW